MPRKVLILDTSILCCLLSVEGKDTCGSGANKWDKKRIDDLLSSEEESVLVLPLATIIETGNHIAQSRGNRFDTATRFCELLQGAADGTTPWAAFSEQAELWSSTKLKDIALTWPELAKAQISLGDATIKDVAEYYARGRIPVEIVTGDEGLKAYEPAQALPVPRRRR